MTEFEEARRTILESVAPAGVERVQLLDSAGRILAADFLAPGDLPRVDKSAMDGFAVRSADCLPGATLKVTGYLPAGSLPGDSVDTGCAIRIMTGAPIPPGADAVVPLEATESSAVSVTLQSPVERGMHISHRGSDVQRGDRLVAAGALLGPPQIGLLASFGCAMIPVYRKLRVAIVSSGDELVELGVEPRANQLVNSNAFALAAGVKLCGAEPVLLGIARDTRESHRALLEEGLQADVVVTSAGVSAGDRDLVRETLASLGVKERFWKVAMRPGGATFFGMKDSVPVFSLPGNPGATMIAFEELVRPALLRMMGQQRVIRRKVRAYLKEDVRKKAGVLVFLTVQAGWEQGNWQASTAGEATTRRTSRQQYYNAVALLPADRSTFAAGEAVDLHILDQTIEMEA
ncbi:MAG TPA: gephyrin-like molybdotransferase Glp [Geomonas sp.]|nr:gephyrin-like molybdotransferase Glp [Geomonas sp.]